MGSQPLTKDTQMETREGPRLYPQETQIKALVSCHCAWSAQPITEQTPPVLRGGGTGPLFTAGGIQSGSLLEDPSGVSHKSKHMLPHDLVVMLIVFA